MEASALFVICSTFGLASACVCGIVANRANSEEVDMDAYKKANQSCQKVASKAVYFHLKGRGMIA